MLKTIARLCVVAALSATVVPAFVVAQEAPAETRAASSVDRFSPLATELFIKLPKAARYSIRDLTETST